MSQSVILFWQEKRKIVGVDDVIDDEEYNKVKDMTPFAVEVDTRIQLGFQHHVMIIMKGR